MRARAAPMLHGALLAVLAAAARGQDAPPAAAPDAPAAPTVPDAPAAPDAPTGDAFAPLGTNPLLRDLEVSTDLRCEAVAVAWEMGGGATAARMDDAKWLLSWWTEQVAQAFATDYAGPAHVAPRAGRARVLVVVVRQPNVFAALREQAGVRDVRDGQAFFAPQLPGVVALDPGGPVDEPPMQALVRPVLHAATHALVDACLAPGAPPPPAWLLEGLAERLSSHGARPGSRQPAVCTQDAEALRALARTCRDRAARVAGLHSLPGLLEIASLADLDARSTDMGVPAQEVLTGFAHEASLFLGWLDESVHSKPDRGAGILRAVLAGQPCAPALAAALDGAAPAAAESDFTEWLRRQMNGAVHSAGVSEFTLQPPAIEPGELRPGVLARPAHLALPAGDVACERALALQLAADGDLAAAAAALERLRAAPNLPAADAAALQTEQRLCLALDDLRRRWLGEHAGKNVELRDGGAAVKLSLVSASGGKLVVKDKGKQRELPESACLPGTLVAQLIAPGTLLPAADDEARAFAWLLAADAAWRDKTAPRLRKDSGPEAARVLDLRPELEARLALGRALTQLATLAGTPLPSGAATDAERDAWLAAARAVAAARSLPVVAERLPALRSLAGQVLGSRFDAAPLRLAPLRAKVEELGGGRVRATWDFSDPVQLEDWSSQPALSSGLAGPKALHQLTSPAGLAVVKGALQICGDGDWRCALGFTAPLTIEYDLSYVMSPDEQRVYDNGGEPPDAKLVQDFELCLCTDPAGAGLRCYTFGHLAVVNDSGEMVENDDGAVSSAFIGAPYHIRLEHDGQQLRSIVEGAPSASVPASDHVSGSLELWHHTERTILLRKLIVEGVLDPAAFAPRRNAWVAAQLAQLGLGDEPAIPSGGADR